MKKLLFILFVLVFQVLKAQQNTFILIRHAEKDTTQVGSTTMNANPPLNKKGLKRAKKLVKVLKPFKVDEIYSTDFLRTKSTVEPLAAKKGLKVEIYSHKQLKEFAALLTSKQNKIIIIAGHSNSTPALVNLIIKRDDHKALDESIYNKIYIIRQNGNEFVVEIKEY